MTSVANNKTAEAYSWLDIGKGPSSKASMPRNEEELVDRMASICQQTLEELQPVLNQITQVCLRPFLPLRHEKPRHIDLISSLNSGWKRPTALLVKSLTRKNSSRM
jgi:hypothetical protein